MRHYLLVLMVVLVPVCFLTAQPRTNSDPAKGFVNVEMPRTPESAGFEKYGTFSVSEFSGKPNIAIPVYTLKSRHMEVPISLSYQADGIKVAQEASWVGLGFDLNVGGRITVETRGSVDFCGTTNYLYGKESMSSGMQRLFNRLGSNSENAILTFATIVEPYSSSVEQDPLGPDKLTMIQDMTQFGAGEPDIFRANFMGHSLSFYYDKISPYGLNWLGEKSTFQVFKNTDANNNILNWIIRDNDGISYLFEQVEKTTNTLGGSPVVPSSTTSAWLLTKMIHPQKDTITFTYSNYGLSCPATPISASVVYAYNRNEISYSDDPPNYDINVNVQEPYYLTKIESANVAVDFSLDSRVDLYGPGSKKLTQITITDKLTSQIKKTASFNYSYFQSDLNDPYRTFLKSQPYIMPSGLSKSEYIDCSDKRLKLDSVNINGSEYQQPYRFYYYSTIVPDKYSQSQDHWGFYNGVFNNNTGYRFTHMIPSSGFGLPGNSVPSTLSDKIGSGKLGYTKDCEPNLMKAMTLDSIVYPTGGSTKFIYEPHESVMFPTTPIVGGGLRTKEVRNYAPGSPASIMTYNYSGGKYMGTIQYYHEATALAATNGTDSELKLVSNGAVNYNDILVGYGQVKVIQKTVAGATLGSVVKTFNIATPQSLYSGNSGGISSAPLGFDVVPAHWYGQGVPNPITNGGGSVNEALAFLHAPYSGFAPTPSSNLQGKLMEETYYDNNDSLISKTNYYYRLADYSNNFFDVKAVQNRAGGFNSTGSAMNGGWGTYNRPVILFISPAKSFRSLTDSVIETTYGKGIPPIITKKYFAYDNYYQLKTQKELTSRADTVISTFTHPYDYLPVSPSYLMMSAHIYSPVFSTTTTRNNQPISVFKNDYIQTSDGIFAPQNVQAKISNYPNEVREIYSLYDSYGHLLEKQKPGGVKESYLWGYNAHYPVAAVTGVDYTTVAGLVNNSVINKPASDAALRDELKKIKTNIPSAQVTTYTYDPVNGLTSTTDNTGRTSYYNYDNAGRLSFTQDQFMNVTKRFDYKFHGQPDIIKPVTTIINGMVSTASPSMPYVVTFTNTVTSASSSYNVYPGTSIAALGNLPVGTYNVNFAPMYTFTGSMQLMFNGATYTGTSFYIPNTTIYTPVSFSIQPTSSGSGSSCSFSFLSGYSSPSNSISNSGSTVSAYFILVPSSTMQPGYTYNVATINGSCKPGVTRQISVSGSGRNWTITIESSGKVWVQMGSGYPPLNGGSSVSFNTFTYNL